MRHLFVTQDYGPDLGGMARRHVEVCRRLAIDGVTVSTVAAPDHGEFDRHEPYPIIRRSFPFERANRFTNQMKWAGALARLASEHDIMHCGNIRPTGYAAWWASRRTSRPYLLYTNGGDLLRELEKARQSRLKRATCRAIFSGAAGIVATSEWVADKTAEVMRSVGISQAPPVRAIHLGTDPTRFHPSRAGGKLRAQWGAGDDPLILTVARLVPHKGQDTGIRALASLSSEFPTLRYVLVGEGHDGHRLRHLARELGIADRVVFAGRLDDRDLPEAYATSTVYLGLSRVDRERDVEGFGISFLEASASGLPIVAGDSGGVRSAVRDGETGYVVPPTDIATVVAAVATLLRDGDLRRSVGAAGRRAVESHYNWDRVGSDTRAFARELLAGTAS